MNYYQYRICNGSKIQIQPEFAKIPMQTYVKTVDKCTTTNIYYANKSELNI